MSSSDIYQAKESPWEKQKKSPPISQRRRRRGADKSFDETINRDLSQTHRRRRRRNSGVRHFRHQMKKTEYAKRFWVVTLSVSAAILAVLILWDSFFRYPKQKQNSGSTVYRIEIE